MYVRTVHPLMSTELENKKYSLQAITASERGKRRGAEAAADSHLIKCPICSGKCHMCSAGSWGHTPQHSFSLTSAAAPEVGTQDLQCWGLARSTGSFIHHRQTYTTMIQPRCVCSGFNTNYSMKFDRVQPMDWGYTHLITVHLQFKWDESLWSKFKIHRMCLSLWL